MAAKSLQPSSQTASADPMPSAGDPCIPLAREAAIENETAAPHASAEASMHDQSSAEAAAAPAVDDLSADAACAEAVDNAKENSAPSLNIQHGDNDAKQSKMRWQPGKGWLAAASQAVRQLVSGPAHAGDLATAPQKHHKKHAPCKDEAKQGDQAPGAANSCKGAQHAEEQSLPGWNSDATTAHDDAAKACTKKFARLSTLASEQAQAAVLQLPQLGLEQNCGTEKQAQPAPKHQATEQRGGPSGTLSAAFVLRQKRPPPQRDGSGNQDQEHCAKRRVSSRVRVATDTAPAGGVKSSRQRRAWHSSWKQWAQAEEATHDRGGALG